MFRNFQGGRRETTDCQVNVINFAWPRQTPDNNSQLNTIRSNKLGMKVQNRYVPL